MAFTAEEIIGITKITGITGDYLTETALTARFDYYSQELTDDVLEAVRTLIEEWETTGSNFVAIEPKESNFGARINPNAAKNEIRKSIATLLYLNEFSFGSSQLVRS